MTMTKKNGRTKNKKHKPGEPRENPVSLAPLNFEQALAGLLAVKPTPDDKKKPEQEENKELASE